MFIAYNHMDRKVKGFSGFCMARDFARLNRFTVKFNGLQVFPASDSVQDEMLRKGFVS